MLSGTPHGRNQLGRVDRQTADIGRTQGVIDRLQIGGGQYQGVVAQGGLDGQGRPCAGGSDGRAIVEQGDAQRQLVPAHQGQVGERHAGGEHDGHGGQVNEDIHISVWRVVS